MIDPPTSPTMSSTTSSKEPNARVVDDLVVHRLEQILEVLALPFERRTMLLRSSLTFDVTDNS